MRPLWNWTRERESRPDPVRTDIRILLISQDEGYREEWQRIFLSHGWGFECTPTLETALQALQTHRAPVVVYDSQAAADEDWREVLNALQKLPQQPCVLVASSVIDEGFRDDVVRLHGYDVLRRQADEDEIARTINSAWFWKHRNA